MFKKILRLITIRKQMMFKTSTVICLLLAVLGMSMQNCNVINPQENTPTYIHIDSFSMPNFSHKITAVWVYYNNNPVGVFDLPATFPITATGTGKVLFAAGVPVDGQNSKMTNYPFYTIDTFTLTAQPGAIVTHQPVTNYYPKLNINPVYNFDDGITGFAKAGGNINMVTVGADSLVFEGTGSGGIFLNAVGDSSIDSTVSTFTIPAGRPAFIEFDYNTTVPFVVGLEGTLNGLISTGPYYLAGVKPGGNQWQKFYLNVQAFATTYNATSYHFYLKAVLGEGQTSGRMLIDNIKLVTFPF
jgi:hypothetical protein